METPYSCDDESLIVPIFSLKSLITSYLALFPLQELLVGFQVDLGTYTGAGTPV